jgi:hypothetical protein
VLPPNTVKPGLSPLPVGYSLTPKKCDGMPIPQKRLIASAPHAQSVDL